MTTIVAMPSIAKQDLAFGGTISATLSSSQFRLISAERSHSATFFCFNGHSKSFFNSRSLLSRPCNGLGLLSFKPCRKPGLKVQTKAYETGKDDVFSTVITTVVAMASIAKQDLAFGGTISPTLSSSQFRLISAGRSQSATFFGFNGHSKTSLSSRSLISPSCSGLGLLSFKPCRKPGQKVQTKAYETGKDDVFASAASDSSVGESESVKKKVQTVKIGIYFATWWSLNVVFNIYNKKVLNAFPYPWLTSTLSLAAGSLIMLVSWMIRIAEFPTIDLDFWKVLAPVAFAHTIGHVAATISMSKVAVSFTHIIKSAEPAFSVLVSRFILGDHFPLPVYLSLIPIIGGCGLTALTELNFNMTGFMGAMISNVAFVFRNIFSKKGMKGKSVSGMNYYACLSILSLLLLAPFAFAVEGPQLWASGWQKAVQDIGPQFVWWVVAQSVFYHLYNQVSYMSLDEISPLTFSIGNTMKRVSVIVSSILIFHTPVRPINAVGAAIAIFGTFLYSQAKQ